MSKNRILFSLIISVGASLTSLAPIKVKANTPTPPPTVYRSSLPSEIDLNNLTDEEIRDYYSSLNSLSEEERQGNNLLKNLKSKLRYMDYFSYDNIWKIYEITDRNWELSPASDAEFGGFDAISNKYEDYKYSTDNTNTKNNPYVRTLYRDPNNEDGYIRNWGDHTANGTNREHVWPQSRGFSASPATGPAGTDLHHLISGDGYVNQTTHNNYPYGFVQTVENSGNKVYTAQNKRGIAEFDGVSMVFEPADYHKGDIARAIFYMAARYNNWGGGDNITEHEPFLEVVNEYTGTSSVYSTNETSAKMGILSDLLVWHKIDPVDEFEIHRNNLIYRNFQGNRNPFIDFPQWVDYIYGTVDEDGNYNSTPTGFAKPQTDAIYSATLSLPSVLNISVGEEKAITIKTKDGSAITLSIEDSEIASISKSSLNSAETVTIKGLKQGKTVLRAKATIEGEEITKECLVNVTSKYGITDEQMKILIIVVVVAIVLLNIVIIIASRNKKVKNALQKNIKKQVKRQVKTKKKTTKRK